MVRAGIEVYPGPLVYSCPVCSRTISERKPSVQCFGCGEWLHIGCSGLKNSRERQRRPQWTGPCCAEQIGTTASDTHQVSSPCPRTGKRAGKTNQNKVTNSTQILENLTILQFNANGISGKIDEIILFMEQNGVRIAIIQETKLSSASKLNLSDKYTLIRKDRETNKGGGVAFIIESSIPFRIINSALTLAADKHIEELTIALDGKSGELSLRNIYIPPQSSCESGYTDLSVCNI